MEEDFSEMPRYSTFTLIRDIRELMQPYKYRFLFATILRFTGDVMRLYPAYAFAQIISLLTKAGADAPFGELAYHLNTTKDISNLGAG